MTIFELKTFEIEHHKCNEFIERDREIKINNPCPILKI